VAVRIALDEQARLHREAAGVAAAYANALALDQDQDKAALDHHRAEGLCARAALTTEATERVLHTALAHARNAGER
jgi:hypothetical protein